MKASLALAACLLASTVRAGERPLDKAFLEYLEQFGDDQGEVFDPADLAAAPPAPDTPVKTAPESRRESEHHD